MKSFLALLKSEHLEHRGGQLWTPLILAGMVLILVIVGKFHEGSMIIRLADNSTVIDVRDVADVQSTLRDEVGHEKMGPALQALAFASNYFSIGMLMAIAVIVSYFQMVGSLHAERADRSILFWKSMPVSDLKVVIAKFVAATFVTILLAGFIGVAASVIGMLIHAIAGPLGQTPEWRSVLHPAVIGSVLTLFLSSTVFYVLWAAPVYGWIMLASAWAPRSPLLYVTVPPVVFGVVEMLTTRKGSLLWQEIGSRIGGTMLGYDSNLGSVFLPPDTLAGMLMDWSSHTAAVALPSPRFWLGIALAALFIWGASEIRRRRVA